MAGVFSGYAPQVKQISSEMGIEQEELRNEIGRRRLLVGQESMIREIAQDLMNLQVNRETRPTSRNNKTLKFQLLKFLILNEEKICRNRSFVHLSDLL